MRKPVLLTLLLVGLGLAAGVVAVRQHLQTPAPGGCERLATVRCTGVREVPPFRLVAHDGQPFTEANLRGHYSLVFLGFTHCPDVCPTTLAQLKKAQQTWQAQPAASRPRIVFVSVDPERDSPAHTGRYAHAFHPDTLAVTGEIAQLERFGRSLSLVFMKRPPKVPGGYYAVDHSSALAVINPAGQMVGSVQPDAHGNFDIPALVADIAVLSTHTP